MPSPADEAIDVLKDEHRSMAAVVKGMQARIAAVAKGTEGLDVHLLRAMLDYIETLPDRVHHPKEDQYLFRILRQRSAQAAPMLDALEAEHVQARELLVDLRATLEAARPSQPPVALAQALDDYAAFLWQHMRREEEEVLPLALRVLTEVDWLAIAAAFAANRNLAF